MVDPDNIEWVPFAIALDMVEKAECTANPRRFLWNAIRQKHIRAGYPTFEGGPDPLFLDTSYTPDKYSERDREGLTIVDRKSLKRYLEPTVNASANLAVASPRQPKRAPRGYGPVDAPLVEKMHAAIRDNPGMSASAAALLFVDEAKKGGSTDSTQRRLQRSYAKKYGANGE